MSETITAKLKKFNGDNKMSIKVVKKGNTVLRETQTKKKSKHIKKYKYKNRLTVGSVLHLGGAPYEYLGNGFVGSNTKRI